MWNPLVSVVVFAGPLKEYGIRDGDVLLLQRVQGERGQPMAGRQLSPSVSSQSSSGCPHYQFPPVYLTFSDPWHTLNQGVDMTCRSDYSKYEWQQQERPLSPQVVVQWELLLREPISLDSGFVKHMPDTICRQINVRWCFPSQND